MFFWRSFPTYSVPGGLPRGQRWGDCFREIDIRRRKVLFMKATFKSRKVFASLPAVCWAFALSSGVLTAADWKIETVDSSGAGMFTSLKIDKFGNAHVAYVPEAEGHPLKYAFRDGTPEPMVHHEGRR